MTYYIGSMYTKFPEKNEVVGFWVTDEINGSFGNTVLKTFSLPNITKLQKTMDHKISMIYNFFYFKCTINLNENFRKTCRKTKMCPFNLRFLRKFLYRITTRSTKSLFLQNYLTKKLSKCLLVVRFKPNVRKTAHPEKKQLDF